jgi:peptide/nickel transport system substrate-binding protein/microcin C transport system substrate-binding protein
LTYTYDLDTTNRYKLFKRAESLFNNSEFAATGLPSPGELALLEPFRRELPPEVFGPAFVAPRTNGDPKVLRENLRKARDLFANAGWKIAADGRMRDAKGEAFKIEYLTAEESTRFPEWELNLEKLGIELKIRRVDFALYRRRLQEYDFDLITIVQGRFLMPWASDLMVAYGSASADEKGNYNFRGVKSKAVDHILDAMGRSTTLDELRDATRAFDRVVMWNYWQIPDLYSASDRASYWNKFGMPQVRPKYFTIESPIAVPAPWPITTWWIKKAGQP